MTFTGYGSIHPSAAIGGPPEHRDYRPGQDMFAPVIDPTAWVAAFVTVDSGLSGPTTIGEHVMLMAKVHVGHDAVVGARTSVAPLTSIGGRVVIGEDVKIGQGCVFRPRVRVGDGAIVGQGAVVIRDIPAGQTWVGNPARRIDPPTPDAWLGSEAEYEAWMEWWELGRHPWPEPSKV